jgi:hypothetical protein
MTLEAKAQSPLPCETYRTIAYTKSLHTFQITQFFKAKRVAKRGIDVSL